MKKTILILFVLFNFCLLSAGLLNNRVSGSSKGDPIELSGDILGKGPPFHFRPNRSDPIFRLFRYYTIRTEAPVQIAVGANILFETRKEVELTAGFEVPLGAAFEINVNPNNIVNCN